MWIWNSANARLRHWWACLTSTLGNHINHTRLFKFPAYLSTSYHYHSIPTTLWCCDHLFKTKNYQSMLNWHFVVTTRIASKNYFMHKSALYQHSLSILEALDFNCSIFPQVLPVSPRWKWLSLRIKASQDWFPELLQQSVAFIAKSLERSWLPSCLVYFPIPSIRTPRKSWKSPLVTPSAFPAPLLLVIKCDLVVFLAYLVKSLGLDVSFMFFSSSIFSPVLSNLFCHSQIYSQLIS